MERQERSLPWARRAGRPGLEGSGFPADGVTGRQTPRTARRERLAHGFRTAAASGEGAR
ncbi:predicted protein [Streptomyces viridosporus ATCC 14672]|uniref:Predicted protein n=1 Tax=Streptomyces viridosporus (strain ATCC 14672 / DSM 40746 / JCM 4963 / KCTC 9882 / NRRL B-12104 / FH 1290) TaxID=566461 RepID=D5ZUC7_STRV1|nr:predicted protein [Streptomyces viridosporus ATCC 14672]